MTTVQVEVWGPGGGGGRGSQSGGGGGGGGYAKKNAMPVSSTVGYTVVVGTGGAGVNAGVQAAGSNGSGSSSFTGDSSTVVSASEGGGGGFSNSGGCGGGGGGTGTGGDVNNTGGSGGSIPGGNGASASGGGGAAGPSGNGTSSSSPGVNSATTGGAGNGTNSGNGGDGNRSNGGGGAGNNYGGGAGGGALGSSNTAPTGAGANGLVVITAPLGTIASATGGTHTSDATNDYWTFTASGTWTPTFSTPPLTFSVSDTTAITEFKSAVIALLVSASDTTAITESVDVKEHLIFSVSDTSNVTEALSIKEIYLISVSDTTAITELVNLQVVKKISVSDTTAVTELVTITEFTFISSDVPGTVNVSDYKWLSSTLKTAQQGPGFRPYYTCKIVDDMIVPNAIITPPGVPLRGGAVAAPDGSMLAVGDDGSGNLKFWKLPDASTGWGSPSATISSSYRSDLNSDIEVSEYYNGSYVIDIFYWKNNAGALNIRRSRSTDGGLTFTDTNLMDPGISNATTDNVYLAAGKPQRDAGGTVHSFVFYLKNTTGLTCPVNSYKIVYQIDSSTTVIWPEVIDSKDWVMQSLDTIFVDGVFHIVFAGYHTKLETVPNTNFGIYSVNYNYAKSGAAGNQERANWSYITPVFTATSNTNTNLNSYTYPRLSLADGQYFLTFKGVVVDSVKNISNSGNITTQTFRFLSQTTDFINFSYPAPLIFTDGTIFSSDGGYNFIQNGSYCYVLGSGTLWQYLINSVTADVTDSLLSYKIDEGAGSASQIVLQIANMNNQWVGPSPTKTGAAAIAKDRKIYLEQGYYNASSVGEIAPRNIFYIDDIKQSVDASSNVITVVGRDLAKKLKVLTTKYAYSFRGPSVYTDTFNGYSLGNWNIISGTWSESGNALVNTGTGLIALNGVDNSTPSAILACIFRASQSDDPSSSTIYPIYQDSNNYVYVRFKIFDHVSHFKGLYVGVAVNGVEHDLAVNQNANMYANTSDLFPIFIRKRNFTTFDIIVGSAASGNTPSTFDPATYSGGSPFPFSMNNDPLTIDVSQYFTSLHYVLTGPVAFATDTLIASIQYFKFFQFNNSLSIQEATEAISTLAGVMDYKAGTVFDDSTFPAASYNGVYSLLSGMNVAPGVTVMNLANPIDNGDLVFTARVLPTDPTQDYGFSIIFRGDSGSSLSKYYRLWVRYRQVNGITSMAMFIDQPSENMLTSTTTYDYTPWTGSAAAANPLPFTPDGTHTYKIVMVDQTFYFFVDGRLMHAWQDNNTTLTSADFSNGYWGVRSDTNSTLILSNVKSNMMWNELDSIVMNPGDDAENTEKGVVDMVRGFTFSDMMGRQKTIVLNSTDPTTFTYSSLLYSQKYDNSDKEYVNQVTVYGNGVSASVRDTASIAATGKVREMTISDYKILTYKDAVLRANYELINSKKFNSQNDPMNPLNVGAEIFDAITITDTGDNSTNVNGNFRVYNQEMLDDGSKGRYGLQIETGTL